MFQKSLQKTLLGLKRGGHRADERETRRADQIITDFGQRLHETSFTDDHLRNALKLYQYQLHEVNVLEELEKSCTNLDTSYGNTENPIDVGLPELRRNRSSLRPTTLLDRVVNKHKMEREIVIPTMVLKDSSSSRGSYDTWHKSAEPRERGERYSRKKQLPHFNYAHGEGLGTRRNLPGQPELIRLLTDPEINLGGEEVAQSNNEMEKSKSISLLSLYGGSMSPPLIDRQKQQRRRKRRIVCKFCRRPPGDHQKWCIYFDFGKINEEEQTELARSLTEEEIKLTNNNTVKTPEPERSKTSMADYMIRPDLPDYKPLHRDVYIRALADARGRLIMQRSHDFMNQLTKPFVFSYFAKLNGPKFRGNKINGMKHIFGEKNADFTEYYKLFAKESKEKWKQRTLNT